MNRTSNVVTHTYYLVIGRRLQMIAIYVRVSTEDQLKGYSVEGQIEDCVALAGTSNVLKYVDDGISGEVLNRPDLSRLLNDVEEGLIEKVICYDPDRLSRKLLNQLIITEKLEKNNVKLRFVKSDYNNDAEGQLYFQVRGAFSEFDKAKIKHNTMRGRYQKAKQGLVIKNSGLYGYQYDQEKKTYVIDESEARVVQMIFNYFTDPQSNFRGINGIAHHLTDIGVPTARGGKVWHRQVVRQMLMNESYTGTFYQNKYDTEGDYVSKQSGETYKTGRLRPRDEWLETTIPQIITDEQFDYAQMKLKQARRRYTVRGRHTYLLSGLVRCGRCGETMTGRKRKSHGKDFFVYECRKNYAGAKSNGCGRMMSENKLNNHVWGKVIDLLNNPQQLKTYDEGPQESYLQDEVEHIQKEIDNVRKGRGRLLNLVSMSDDLDIGEVKDKIRELQNKESDLKQHLDRLSKEMESEQDINKTTALLEDALEYYLSFGGENISIENKQKMIGMIIEEVEVIDAEQIVIHTF